jgi:acyl dehydratase
MAVYLDRVGAQSSAERFEWSPRACSLYALAVGAGIDDLAFTTEGNAGVPQRVYPSFPFAIVAEVSARWPDPCFGTGDFPLEKVMLGEQGLTLHRAMPTSGAVLVRTHVEGIYDKGSAALVVLEQQGEDAETGEPMFTSTVDLFVGGEGGFGGAPRPDTGRRPMPRRTCDDAVVTTTLPVQTLLYRHGGNDANPLHVDPAFAAAVGLPGPVLSGQNTLGIACRSIVHRLAHDDPTRLRSIGGRFVAPALNGDVLRTELWVDGEGGGTRAVRFRVVDERERVIVDRGLAHLSD